MAPVSGIYQIQSKIKPERIYIGSAMNIKDRWKVHLRDFKQRGHHSVKFKNHFNKYGESDLIFTIIEPCFSAFLLAREQYYLDTLKPYFNLCKIAGSRFGVKGQIPWNKGKKDCFSDETIQQMSNSHKGQSPSNKGTKGVVIAWNKGKKTGKPSWNKGMKNVISEDTRKRMSDARKGKYADANHPFFGKHHKPESNLKNKIAHINKLVSEITKQKMLER